MTPEEIAKLPYRPCVGVMLMNAEGHVFVGQRRDRDTDAWQIWPSSQYVASGLV